jgi:hypothetical protein
MRALVRASELISAHTLAGFFFASAGPVPMLRKARKAREAFGYCREKLAQCIEATAAVLRDKVRSRDVLVPLTHLVERAMPFRQPDMTKHARSMVAVLLIASALFALRFCHPHSGSLDKQAYAEPA